MQPSFLNGAPEWSCQFIISKQQKITWGTSIDWSLPKVSRIIILAYSWIISLNISCNLQRYRSICGWLERRAHRLRFKFAQSFSFVFYSTSMLHGPLAVSAVTVVVFTGTWIIRLVKSFRWFNESFFCITKGFNTWRPELAFKIWLACAHIVISGSRVRLNDTKQVLRALMIQEISCLASITFLRSNIAFIIIEARSKPRPYSSFTIDF